MRADLTKVPVLAVGGTLFASVLVMAALCFALRPLLARYLGVDGPAFTSLFQGATRWQTFVALPVAGNLFGDLGLALASVAMVAMTPVLNVLCVSVLVRYASPTTPDWRAVLLAIVQNPLIWSCVVGIVLNPVACAIPQPVHVFVDALGRSSLALGLLIVGAGLRIGELIRPRALDAGHLRAEAGGDAGDRDRASRSRSACPGANLLVVVCCTGGAGRVEFLHPGAPDGRRRAADGADPDVGDRARGHHDADRDQSRLMSANANGRALRPARRAVRRIVVSG